MPLTSLRYTIWGDDLFHKQTSIWRAMLDDVRVKQQISIFD
jgi:hypothetical protein